MAGGVAGFMYLAGGMEKKANEAYANPAAAGIFLVFIFGGIVGAAVGLVTGAVVGLLGTASESPGIVARFAVGMSSGIGWLVFGCLLGLLPGVCVALIADPLFGGGNMAAGVVQLICGWMLGGLAVALIGRTDRSPGSRVAGLVGACAAGLLAFVAAFFVPVPEKGWLSALDGSGMFQAAIAAPLSLLGAFVAVEWQRVHGYVRLR